MPFQKGQSGNPNGRPKIADEFRDKSRKAADDHVLDAWIEEVENRGKEWVRCSELLVAYGYGRPPQSVEHTGAVDGPLTVKVRLVKS